MDFGTDTGIDAGAGNRGRRRTGTDRFGGAIFFAERGTDCTANNAADCAAHGAAHSITEYEAEPGTDCLSYNTADGGAGNAGTDR